jgi:hypothetical protein
MCQPYREFSEKDDPAKRKRGISEICGRARNEFTLVKCSRCKIFICKEYSKTRVI